MLTFLLLIEDPEEQRLFEKLYLMYEQLLYHTAFAILKDQQLAEDAVHNTFLKLLSNMDKISAPDARETKSFLCVLAKNSAIDIYRKRARKNETPADMLPCVPAADSTSESADTAHQIIRILPLSYQNIFILKYVHEYSDKEIAALLDLKPGTVRQKLRRGRLMLQEKMTDPGGDTDA